jgi:hypothetical protein
VESSIFRDIKPYSPLKIEPKLQVEQVASMFRVEEYGKKKQYESSSEQSLASLKMEGNIPEKH